MSKNYTLNIEHVQKKTGRTDKKHIKAKQNEKTEKNRTYRTERAEMKTDKDILFISFFNSFYSSKKCCIHQQP